MNKVDELECVLLQHDPHIIAITETWLHEDIADVFLGAYNVLRTYRQGAEARWRFTEVLPLIDTHESVWCKLFFVTVRW